MPRKKRENKYDTDLNITGASFDEIIRLSVSGPVNIDKMKSITLSDFDEHEIKDVAGKEILFNSVTFQKVGTMHSQLRVIIKNHKKKESESQLLTAIIPPNSKPTNKLDFYSALPIKLSEDESLRIQQVELLSADLPVIIDYTII